MAVGSVMKRNDCFRLAMLAACPAVLLLACQATWPWPFFSDDAFISLRYAERLLAGDGLTWTDGSDGLPERVEGYSNLLWVLLTAGLGALGLEGVTAARLLGAVCTMLSLWWLAFALRPNDLRTTLLAAVPPLLVASTQTVLVWTLGGLEGPLLLLLLAWGFARLAHHSYREPDPAAWSRTQLLWLGLPFALACWTRPDGPLWALTAGVGLWSMAIARSAAMGRATATAFWFGLPAVLAVVLQLGFRLAYHGDIVPNTAHVKAELAMTSLDPGLRYVTGALLAMPGLTTLALLGAVLLAARARPRTFVVVLLLPVAVWLTYLAAIGGDHFPGRRLLHGALSPMALLAGLGLRSLGKNVAATAVAMVAGLTAAATDVWRSRSDAQSHEIRAEIWEWRGKVLGEVLGRAFAGDGAAAEPPRIAVDAAGALPYYSGLPALDLLGLCDRTIATTPFPAWLRTVREGIPLPPGHLRGNGAYVMEQAPDLMLFSNPPGLPLPVFVSACEFEDDPRFLDGYRAVLLDLGERELLPGHTEALLAPLWVRVEGRAGVERTADQVVVPAWLFGSFRLPGATQARYQVPQSADEQRQREQNLSQVLSWYTQRTLTAVPTAAGAPALRLMPGQSASFTLRLPTGSWRMHGEPADSGVNVSAPSAVDGDTLVVVDDAEVTLELRAADTAGARPRRIVLTRVPD